MHGKCRNNEEIWKEKEQKRSIGKYMEQKPFFSLALSLFFSALNSWGINLLVDFLTPLVANGLKSVIIFGVPVNIEKVRGTAQFLSNKSSDGNLESPC